MNPGPLWAPLWRVSFFPLSLSLSLFLFYFLFFFFLQKWSCVTGQRGPNHSAAASRPEMHSAPLLIRFDFLIRIRGSGGHADRQRERERERENPFFVCLFVCCFLGLKPRILSDVSSLKNCKNPCREWPHGRRRFPKFPTTISFSSTKSTSL